MSVCFDFVFCLCSLLFAAVRRHHHLSLCSPAFSLPYLIPLSHSTLSHSVIPHSLIPPFRSLPFHSLIPPFRSLSFRHSAFYHSVIPLSLRHSDLSHSSSLRHPSPYSNLLFRVKVSSQPPPWPRVSSITGPTLTIRVTRPTTPSSPVPPRPCPLTTGDR